MGAEDAGGVCGVDAATSRDAVNRVELCLLKLRYYCSNQISSEVRATPFQTPWAKKKNGFLDSQ